MTCSDCKDDQVFCRACRFWTPVYSSIGVCEGQGTVSSKFWVEGDKEARLLTTATHGCRHFEAPPALAEEIL